MYIYSLKLQLHYLHKCLPKNYKWDKTKYIQKILYLFLIIRQFAASPILKKIEIDVFYKVKYL